jgi:Tfp pilus assembly PilM family ATPase
MQLFSKRKPLVGLDIGSSAIKAVELTKSKNGYQVTGFAWEVPLWRIPSNGL